MAQVREMPASEQNEILRDARKLAEEGDYERASQIAFRVLERAPNSALALHLLGYIYLMVDKQVMAYQFYRRALQVDSRHAEIWNNFGRAADELHLYDESESAFKRVLQIDPKYAAGWANLAVSLINQARYKEALVAAEKAIELDPEAKNGWINIGFASLALGDWQRGWHGYHMALGGKFRQPVCYGVGGELLYAEFSTPVGVLAVVTDPTLRVGDLEIDPVRHRATRGGQRIQLTAKEFALLSLLAERSGEVLSRTQIASLVWDIHFDSDSNVVEVAVRRAAEAAQSRQIS